MFTVGPADTDRSVDRYDIHTTIGDNVLLTSLKFQKGPVREVGINGISDEALLAVVLDRLTCFQQSRYACRETNQARNRVEEAIQWLKTRTTNRMIAGVEGTREKG